MHPLIEECIEIAKSKVCLHDHHLYSYEIYREKDALYKTRYHLEMEWFPHGVKKRKKGGLNPTGAAVISMDIYTKQFNRIIFTGGKGSGLKVNQVEKWVEEMAGIGPNQYTAAQEKEGDYEFRASLKGLPVYPGGYINIQLDLHKNITLFSLSGFFPNQEEAGTEEFLLHVNEISPLSYNQLRFYEFPSQKQKRWMPLFSIEEVFVVNQDQSLISYDITGEEQITVYVNENLKWKALEQVKKTKLSLLDWNQEAVTIENVLEHTPHSDLNPLTQQQIENAKCAALVFMQHQFPKESGVWNLVNVKRDGGYIVALLKMHDDHSAVPRWKRLFLDKEGQEVIQVADNDLLMDMVSELGTAGPRSISKEDAFSKLQPHLQMKPYYVFHRGQKRYVLAAKLDCQYAVVADTGELMELDKI